jgi:hypothetical protein
VSDNYFRFIPTSPTYVPDAIAQHAGTELVQRHLPHADEVCARVFATTRFVDPGANFEGVFCAHCDEDLTEWWSAAMDHMAEADFSNLSTTVPCCGIATTLNDLRYEWPAGFARFFLEVRGPGVPEPPTEMLEALQRTLGCELRTIWVHY